MSTSFAFVPHLPITHPLSAASGDAGSVENRPEIKLISGQRRLDRNFGQTNAHHQHDNMKDSDLRAFSSGAASSLLPRLRLELFALGNMHSVDNDSCNSYRAGWDCHLVHTGTMALLAWRQSLTKRSTYTLPQQYLLALRSPLIIFCVKTFNDTLGREDNWFLKAGAARTEGVGDAIKFEAHPGNPTQGVRW